ncbi:MAG: hypothetical protein ACD_46C00722G0007 [uncultured bacterium]|nr:MAG: hypothetical protein ACD_46C00722G0007 [uncultured bacterium]
MKSGLVRIIGGKWRGRRLTVPDVQDLRPTPDRVRETLFNWLAPFIQGAHCLDLFAGSGVLGFEAASREAASVVMFDSSKVVVQLLQEEAKQLGAENIQVYCATIPEQLQNLANQFDIIFLDPPYQQNLLLPTCCYLEKNNFLADIAYIYLEAREAIKDNDLPSTWRIIKHKQAGQVHYHLAVRERDKK